MDTITTTTTAAAAAALPDTHRALVLHSQRDPLDASVETRPTPRPTPGSAVVRVLAAAVVPYARDVYTGRRPYSFPLPMVPGSSAVARVAALGPDATALRPGQLVFVDCVIRGRDGHSGGDDEGEARALFGFSEGFTPGSRALLGGEWRDSTYAEYARVPLENCFALDEERLLGREGGGEGECRGLGLGGLGCAPADLLALGAMLVPFGGLRDAGVAAGDKVVVTPASGTFGGAAVVVALAMGAREVVAMGRDRAALESLRDNFGRGVGGGGGRVRVVPITGDAEADARELRGATGPADVYFDISPAAASGSTHLRSGILALRQGGRVSYMGGLRGDVAGLPLSAVMRRDLQIRGKWMYGRADVAALVRMAEAGMLPLGPGPGPDSGSGRDRGGIRIAGAFGLDKAAEALDTAAANARFGLHTVIVP